VSNHRKVRFSLFLVLFLLPVLAFSTPLPSHVRVPQAERPAGATCGGDLDAPLDIELDAVSGQRRAGGFVTVFGTVTPRKDIDGLRLRFEAEGSAMIFNPAPYAVGRASADMPIEFSLLVRFGPAGESAVHVWAETDLQQADYRWSKRETLYAIVHRGRLYTGMGDHQRLQRVAIDDDLAAGLTTPDQAQAQSRAMSRVPFTRDARPFVKREFSEAEQRLNAIVGAKPQRGARDRVGAEDHHPSDMILVRGTVRWTDENGTTHPAFGAAVDIRDSDTVFDENIVTTITDVDGNYEAIVDNDDGIGAGDRDIYVRVRTANSLIDTMTAGVFGGTYEMVSGIHDETPDGATITENFTAANTGTGPAVSVFEAATWIAVYARDRNGGSISQVDVVWPNGDDGSFYDGDVMIEQADRWDWDTIHHEYGHYVMDVLDIEDNPGGAHNISDCHADVRGSKSEGLRLAWGEGWPTYFGTAGQAVYGMASLNVPRVGDAAYDDLEDGSVSYSMEAQTNGGQGEDNELAVQRLLWDLFDNANDGRDTISRSDQNMWNAVDGADPETLSGGWGALRSGQSNATQLLMGEIASDHAIGPRLISPAEGATVSPSNANFSWNRDVGCSTTYDGDSFDLVFYDATTLAPVLTLPGLPGTTASLTEPQIATLVAAGHQVLWGVEARNGSSPATGPYLGETFQITVNRPPVPDAGADQTVECTSAGTTLVSLNGTGSSDPDGDTLTYSWSSPGVVFDNPSSPTPTGSFSIGTHTVTLTVSDGIASDSDTVSITVEDTTPPTISCPLDITVECTGDLGVQADDPQLAPFFAAVSATDLCDNSPTITNDAPAFFPLGQTIVTFAAEDDHGNIATCSATVTVLDTQAPQITATVTPTLLWPPNHKLVTIEASVTVTDECDPNPTFVLTSIVSNEPDNGLGDGDTANDIQGADYGTADTSFQLRAERAGVAPGRVYTITYTGSDSSGNTAQTQVQVTVPHTK
jgi:hypothetical protein